MAVARKPILPKAPAKKGRPKGSKNKAPRLSLKEPVIELAADGRPILKMLVDEKAYGEKVYGIFAVVRDALRMAGIFNTWRHLQRELWAAKTPAERKAVIDRYVKIEQEKGK